MITYDRILNEIKPNMTDEEREYCDLFELVITASEYMTDAAKDMCNAYLDNGEYRNPARLEKCIVENLDAARLMCTAIGQLWRLFGVNVCDRISSDSETTDEGKRASRYNHSVLRLKIFRDARDTADELERDGAKLTDTWEDE